MANITGEYAIINDMQHFTPTCWYLLNFGTERQTSQIHIFLTYFGPLATPN